MKNPQGFGLGGEVLGRLGALVAVTGRRGTRRSAEHDTKGLPSCAGLAVTFLNELLGLQTDLIGRLHEQDAVQVCHFDSDGARRAERAEQDKITLAVVVQGDNKALFPVWPVTERKAVFGHAADVVKRRHGVTCRDPRARWAAGFHS
jgi:hypothetical protein